MTICQPMYEIIDRKPRVINDLLSEALEALGEHLESYDDINDVYNRMMRAGYTFEHQVDTTEHFELHKIVVRHDGYLIDMHGTCVDKDIELNTKTNCRW